MSNSRMANGTHDELGRESIDGRKQWARPEVQRLRAKEAQNRDDICPNDRPGGCAGGGYPGESDGGGGGS